MHALLLLLIAVSGAESGDSADSAQEAARRDEVAQLAPAKARQIEMLVGDEERKATLLAKPLLRWSNPTAGSVHGEVYLWSENARPVAISSIYRWYHPFKSFTFEVVSTSSTSMQARENDKLLWEAKESGMTWQALDDAPVPSKAEGGRLIQMRQIARRFSANLADMRTGGAAVDRRLRLLSQPVYRYQSPEADIVDGGLFALVEVTDPEVWILVEAVQRDDKTIWQYALARMNADTCEVKLGDKLVQRWDHIVQPWRINKAPYTLLVFQPESVKLDRDEEE